MSALQNLPCLPCTGVWSNQHNERGGTALKVLELHTQLPPPHPYQTAIISTYITPRMGPSLPHMTALLPWLGSAFLLPKLASTTKQQRKQSVLVCSTFSHLCLVLPPIGFGHVRGLHAGNDSRRVVPHCYPHFSLPAGSHAFSRPHSAHKEPQDCICLSSVTCHGQEADITASPDNGGCCCSLT